MADLNPARIAAVALLVTAGALLLVLLSVGFIEVVIVVTGWLDLHRAMGIDTQASQNYDFVSGAGPMMVAALGFSGVVTAVWRHLSCHAPGCWHLGRFPIDHLYRVCAVHHPDVPDGGPSHADLKAAHLAARPPAPGRKWSDL